MKRNKMLLLLAAVMVMTGMVCRGAQVMSVQVRNGQLRATPSFMGSLVGSVAYGARVDILQQQGEWMKVKDAQSRMGWMHQSALTKQRIAMSAGSGTAQTGASGEELALAGKGFNSDVEAEFKSKNRNIDFTWVDKMEKMKVTPQESSAFLKEGGVRPQ